MRAGITAPGDANEVVTIENEEDPPPPSEPFQPVSVVDETGALHRSLDEACLA